MAVQYWLRNRIWPDLDAPRNFSEKLCWLKLNDSTPLQTRCADKLRVRDYVAETVGSEILTALLFQTSDPSELGPENIPGERFVIKTNHDQGGVFKVRCKADADFAGIRRDISRRRMLNHFAYAREPQYRDIPFAILAEEYIDSADGDLKDFKFYCFGGRVELIQVDWNRGVKHRQAYASCDWRQLPVSWGCAPDTLRFPRPARLDEMIAAAEALSRPFRFVRVDLYEAPDGRIRFGEMTFHPGAGLKPFHPPEYERRLGDLLDIGAPARRHACDGGLAEAAPSSDQR